LGEHQLRKRVNRTDPKATRQRPFSLMLKVDYAPDRWGSEMLPHEHMG